MILSAHNCGCPVHNVPQMSQKSMFNRSLYSLKTSDSATSSVSESSSSCESDSETEEKALRQTLTSEIANNGFPYKEIEISFNNNRMIMRVQKEAPKPDFDPPCDCVDTRPVKSDTKPCKHDYVLQKASEGCRTISVYPDHDPKFAELHTNAKTDKLDKREDGKKGNVVKKHIPFPTVNPEENPNIFVLKIRRKCESADLKQNLDLEFKTPRPWRRRTW